MADGFHSPTHSPLGISLNCEEYMNKIYQGDHQGFQDTVPFDDTVALDDSLVGTQTEKLDFNTQVVDVPDSIEDVVSDCEKEVVLDSEDEKTCQVELVGVAVGSKDSDFEVAEDSDSKHCVPGTLMNDKSIHSREVPPQRPTCGQEFARLDYVGSEEPRGSSQDNALNFVDHFLASKDVSLSPGPKARSTVRNKFSCVSSAKGPQRLAKCIKTRNTVGKNGIFEWVNTNQHGGVELFSMTKDISSNFGSCQQRSLERQPKAGHIDSNRGCSTGHECREKSLSFHKEVTDSSHSDSRVAVENENLPAISSGRELDICNIERDTPGMFDAGFNTQMAAEVMEALSYGLPSYHGSSDAYEGPQDSLLDSSKHVTNSEAPLEKASRKNGVLANLNGIARVPKQKMCSAKEGTSSSSWKHPSHPELDYGFPITMKRRRSKHLVCRLNGRNSMYTSESFAKNSPKPVEKRKKEDAMSRNNIEDCENCSSSSTLDKNISLGEQQIQGEVVAHQTRPWMMAGKHKKTESDNQGDRANAVKDCSIITYKRKRGSLAAKPFEVLSAGGKFTESYLNTSGKARDTELSKEKPASFSVPNGSLNLYAHNSIVTYKRQRSSPATKPFEVLSAGGKFTESYLNTSGKGRDNELSEDKPASFSVPNSLNLNAHSSIITYERKRSRLATELCLDTSGKARNNELSQQKPFSVLNSCLKLSAWSCPKGKRAHRTLPRHLNSAGNQNTPVTAVCVKVYHKKLFNKNLPKSPLLRELTRLGIPKPNPDFSWKDLRKRRDMAYVRVLFSQHLDGDIIKQQRKIMVQLGISTATCLMDASHFIADRFVRTRNMLEAIALGKPVVTHLWLESCVQASCLIDEKNYMLRDAKKEKEIGFSLPVSLARANQDPLLKGCKVLVTPNIKPDKEMITNLVKVVQGQLLRNAPQAVDKSQISAGKIPHDLLILSCEEDYAICEPFLDNGAAIYSPEILLNGIVIQKLEYERHQLFLNRVNRNCPGKK